MVEKLAGWGGLGRYGDGSGPGGRACGTMLRGLEVAMMSSKSPVEIEIFAYSFPSGPVVPESKMPLIIYIYIFPK